MAERFSEEVLHIVGAARRLAGRHRHGEIRPEHLLGALVSEGRGKAIDLLKAAEIDLTQLHVKVNQMLEARRADGRPGRPSQLSTQLKRVISNADAEAKRLRRPQVDTEHLLIALTMDDQTPAAHVLTRHGLSLSQVRYTLNHLDPA